MPFPFDPWIYLNETAIIQFWAAAAEKKQAYATMMTKLLPPGKALQESTNVHKLVEAGSSIMADLQQQGEMMVEFEAFPTLSYFWLPLWEEEFGLPDPCDEGLEKTIQERRDDLEDRIKSLGDQTYSFYEELGDKNGYPDIEINTFKPLSVGSGAVGDAVYGDQWRFVFEFPDVSIEYTAMQVGETIGQPLRTYEFNRFACKVGRVFQAHTLPMYNLILQT